MDPPTDVYRCRYTRSGGKRLVAAPPIRSAIDILMVRPTTMSLARTVTNSTLSWWCNYVMQIPTESVLHCKRQFARSGRISDFHISPLQMPPPAQCRPGRMSPFALPLPPPLLPSHAPAWTLQPSPPTTTGYFLVAHRVITG